MTRRRIDTPGLLLPKGQRVGSVDKRSLVLPTVGAIAWGRHSKYRVAAIVEGQIIARVHRGSLIVLSADEWARLRPHEWTEADRLADDADRLLRMLRLPAKSLPSVERLDDRWLVKYYKPKVYEGWHSWEGVPVEYVRLDRPAALPLLEVSYATK